MSTSSLIKIRQLNQKSLGGEHLDIIFPRERISFQKKSDKSGRNDAK